jgi:two-component system, sensor histidine kinase and response regulator
MLRDIAERLHALTALRESEARYRDVSTLTSDFTYALRIAANGRLELEWITDAFTRITGYTCAEVRELGGWTTLIHEDDLPIAQRDAKAIFSGETRVTEVRLITKCGSIRWMRTYGKGVWDNNGQRVIRILGAGQDITARKQAEADRERERDLLTTIINTIPDGIYLKDRESRFIRINQAQARHLGVERVEDAIGKTDFDFFGLTHAQEAFDDEQRIINTGEPMLDRLEHYIAVDGQPIWISATKVPLRNEHGDIIGTVGISRDITARKHAEEALRETEERYRQMFHEHRAIKLLIDPCSGAIVDANQGAADFYGYPLKTLTTMHIYEINTLPADVLLPKFRAAAQREQSHFIFQHRLCSGVIRDVEVNTGPVTVKGRRLLYSIVHDITERRKAEHALRQQNEYLAVLYETTLAVINRLEVADVLDAIVVRAASLAGTTHGFIYLYESGGTSTNSLERHGTRGELIMKVGQGLYRPYVGMRTTQPRGLVGEVWRTGQPLVISDYRTWPGRSPESRWDQLDAVMGVPLTSDGQVIGVLGLAHTEAGRRFHDEEIATLSRFAQLASIALDNARLYTTAQLEILERKRAEERLALARDEAIEAARLKSGFLAMMSHELRTPLNAIIGFTELTLNEHAGPLNQSQRSNLERVSRNAQNLLDIINSILDMSKIDAGYMQLGDEKVSLEDIVRGAVAGIETMLSTKRLKLHLEHLCCGGTSVRGDAMRLHQITLNLLSNAVKFTPESGTIMVTIECGVAADIVAGAVPGDQAPDGEWVVLSVIDTGIGIPPMEQERIWSEFYQIDASTTREYGGTGLGLAIVKRLTLLMGGQVGLRSKPGQGSTFSIWLPPMQVDEPPAQPVPTPTIAEIEYSGD